MERRTNINRLNNDTLEEIFSLLSVKDIALSKCVSKKWQIIMSDFSFVCRYASKSTGISGLFLQQHEGLSNFLRKSIVHVPVELECGQIQENLLNFLPERVSIMSSNNGLLCCRSFVNTNISSIPGGISEGFRWGKIDPKLYVCNPTSKEFITINPPEEDLGVSIGLTFDLIDNSFQLVIIDCHQDSCSSGYFTFSIFSSDTWSWRISEEICNWNTTVHMNKQVFVSGRFHWLTLNHHLITFQIKDEESGIIKLPGPEMNGEGHEGMCLGSSEGHLNYIVVNPSEIRIWVLISYEIPEWVLANRINLIQFCGQHLSQFPQLFSLLQEQMENEETEANTTVLPLAFDEDVIFMEIDWDLFSFNLKTGALKNHCCTFMMPCDVFLSPTVLPYSVNLAALNVFKGIGPGASTSTSINDHTPQIYY
ncbi:F-box protein At5g49610-like [Impatiens glandulifera]|uniref:F-box protein At5g49610-like n=1 Tax=Impatiens glandulifera TaxID=253017 RepID=UPI001FB079B0|nr:F-box protein At5g49610-like [Impatiens glandulifera]XP_047310254.1 F-box protein At5g49610-like [Impatiens glandulifera]